MTLSVIDLQQPCLGILCPCALSTDHIAATDLVVWEAVAVWLAICWDELAVVQVVVVLLRQVVAVVDVLVVVLLR